VSEVVWLSLGAILSLATGSFLLGRVVERLRVRRAFADILRNVGTDTGAENK
jgi:hypothetical protein